MTVIDAIRRHFDRRRDAAGLDRPLDCRAVGRRLQAVLDGETDDSVADAVAAHLEECRECGMEADVYLRIKASLTGDAAIDHEAAARLRSFGAALVSGEQS